MCWQCMGWHEHALKVLAGAPPRGCQECGVTFAFLESCSPDGNTRMYVHSKDGIYQILCPHCSDAYERKRLDLYGGTRYADLKKLKGSN